MFYNVLKVKDIIESKENSFARKVLMVSLMHSFATWVTKFMSCGLIISGGLK